METNAKIIVAYIKLNALCNYRVAHKIECELPSFSPAQYHIVHLTTRTQNTVIRMDIIYKGNVARVDTQIGFYCEFAIELLKCLNN